MPGKSTSPHVRETVISMKEKGLTALKIAEIIGCTERTVFNIIKHQQKYGHNENLPKSGRPRKLSNRDIRHIGQEIQKNPPRRFGISHLLPIMASNFLLKLSQNGQ